MSINYLWALVDEQSSNEHKLSWVVDECWASQVITIESQMAIHK